MYQYYFFYVIIKKSKEVISMNEKTNINWMVTFYSNYGENTYI